MKKNCWLIKALCVCWCCLSYTVFAQSPAAYIWPMDTPHVLTGNYGELRPNHFHAGLDFSTNGKIGFPVYAVANGDVSRIKVSSVGYGRALYITHANGQVSVYAHLSAYAPGIAAAVKLAQTKAQNYEVEFFPAKGEISLKQGELIGYSGNSGGSSGPHLHFELRDEITEIPSNPLTFYRIADTVPPTITDLAFYNLADTLSPAFIQSVKVKVGKRDSLFILKDSVTLSQSALGLAFAGLDRFVRKGNPNVIYGARLYLDEQLIFAYSMQNIAFDEQRYVNEFTEVISKIKYQKCFLPTLYPQAMYGNVINKGRIMLSDTNYHHLKLEVSDESGNSNHVEFYVKRKKLSAFASSPRKGDVFVNCSQKFSATQQGITLRIAPKTLYTSSPLWIERSSATSNTFAILPSAINLASAATIGLQVPKKFSNEPAKLVLKREGSVYVPTVKNDSVFYNVSNFGRFQLMADTMAPKIRTQLTPKKIKRLKKITVFAFVLSDNLSGIGKYSLFVNGSWVIAEYDAKVNLLYYVINDETPPGNLQFRVEAEDKAGNRSALDYTLKRLP